MPELVLDTPARAPEALRTGSERGARRTMLDQVARLEGELSQLFCSTWPRKELEFTVHGRGGPRLLSLAELEELRDDLADRVAGARRALSDRTWVEEQNRRLIEEMLAAPERHKWRRVSAEDIGESGCRHWHVRPRYGALGMLMGWWRVVVSSGCPLAT
ncbi:MAG TPA: hypothetical protein VFB44_02140 [Thermoleophilaceae bacterium]|nr:hypothetical protein [Thermoleophilaceae bacterium]